MSHCWLTHTDLLPSTPPTGACDMTSLAMSGWASIEGIRRCTSDHPDRPAAVVYCRLLGGGQDAGFTQFVFPRATPGSLQAHIMAVTLAKTTETDTFAPYRLMAQIRVVGVERTRDEDAGHPRYHGMIESIQNVYLDNRRVFECLDVYGRHSASEEGLLQRPSSTVDTVMPLDVRLMLEEQRITPR